jgi:hypothetical protein
MQACWTAALPVCYYRCPYLVGWVIVMNELAVVLDAEGRQRHPVDAVSAGCRDQVSLAAHACPVFGGLSYVCDVRMMASDADEAPLCRCIDRELLPT